jgi:hypothetical protein
MKIVLSYKDFTRSTRFSRINTLLADARLSPKDVFTMAVQALDRAFAGMEPGVKYKTEDLFLELDWVRMSDAISRCVGICLSYLTACALIPLQYANRPGANNKLYTPKPVIDPSLYSFSVS